MRTIYGYFDILFQLFPVKENVNGFAMQYPIEGNKDFSESSSDITNLRSQSVDGTYTIEIDEEIYEKFEVKFW
jgi:hypothetical protein